MTVKTKMMMMRMWLGNFLTIDSDYYYYDGEEEEEGNLNFVQ